MIAGNNKTRIEQTTKKSSKYWIHVLAYNVNMLDLCSDRSGIRSKFFSILRNHVFHCLCNVLIRYIENAWKYDLKEGLRNIPLIPELGWFWLIKIRR